jgi:serine/threonine protein kinase SCH9
LTEDGLAASSGWHPLKGQSTNEVPVSGEILLSVMFQNTNNTEVGSRDFQVLKLIGKGKSRWKESWNVERVTFYVGTHGQTYQVRKKDTERIYAMKVFSKGVEMKGYQLPAIRQMSEDLLRDQNRRLDFAFIANLRFSFQTPTDIYLVTDYLAGGELYWFLQKEGRFPEDQGRFYVTEMILALQYLQEQGMMYVGLRPEIVMLDATGHIVLSSFELSTEGSGDGAFPGNIEYLAPEVLLDSPASPISNATDFWSLGVMIFEMCCGWSPFYAEDTQQMFKNIAFGKVRFPRDAFGAEGRNFVKSVLNRNPKHRLGANHGAEELKDHPWFSDTDWDALLHKDVLPPFKPPLRLKLDSSNFDAEFTNALNLSSSLNARAHALAGGVTLDSGIGGSASLRSRFRGFTFVQESAIDQQFDDDEAFDEPSSSHEPVVAAAKAPGHGIRKMPDRTGRPPTSEDFSVFDDSTFEP